MIVMIVAFIFIFFASNIITT